MSTWPGYPDNRLIVGGIDLTDKFKIALLDGYELNPPEPKYHFVDIPGGDGFLDLTTALTGDVVYSQREQKFTFALLYPDQRLEEIKTKLNNLLHGRYFEYQITMDPEYIYKGRLKVSSYQHSAYTDGIVAFIQIEAVADPYKYKPQQTYEVTAPGGRWFHFMSGRKPVRPIIEVEFPTQVIWNRQVLELTRGTYRLNDVLFTEGVNSIYVNTFKIYDTYWSELDAGGKYEMTWDEAGAYSWDEIQRIGISDFPIQGGDYDAGKRPDNGSTGGFNVNKTWADLSQARTTWSNLKSAGIRWRDLRFIDPSIDNNAGNSEESSGSSTYYEGIEFKAYFQYEWGDL